MGCTESKDKSQSQKPVDTADYQYYRRPVKRDTAQAQAELKAKGKQATAATLFEATQDGDLEVVSLCLDAGVDVNAKDSEFRCALHHAALKGHSDITTFLLERDACVVQRDMTGDTPMHLAVAGAGKERVIAILAKWGIDKGEDVVNIIDGQGRTPIFNVQKKTTFTALIEHGADVEVWDRNKATPLHYTAAKEELSGITELLIRHGADMDAQDARGATPLHRAVEQPAETNIALLLCMGQKDGMICADPWIRDNNGDTALDICKNNGHDSTAVKLERRM